MCTRGSSCGNDGKELEYWQVTINWFWSNTYGGLQTARTITQNAEVQF